jgi:hypothetical protein
MHRKYCNLLPCFLFGRVNGRVMSTSAPIVMAVEALEEGREMVPALDAR